MRIILFPKIILISLFFTPFCYSMDDAEEIKEDLHKIQHDLNRAKHDFGIVIGALSPELGLLIGGTPPAIAENPYKNTVAYVRTGLDVSDGEKAHNIKRLPIVKACIERLLNRNLADHQIPKIALVMSGGGYRALLSSKGCLGGFEKIDFLDSCMHVTALSGSTWVVAPWISTDLSLDDFEQYIVNCVKLPFIEVTDEEQLLILQTATVKGFYHQPRTPVDLYGDLLANRLLIRFGDKRQMVYLSEQAKIIENGKHPYPIYVAVDGNEKIVENPDWYEFTPHEVGKCNDIVHIPTWAYGRKFKKGVSVDHAPEKSLGYVIGTCGSAFGANIETIIEEAAKTCGHLKLLEAIVKPIEGDRPLKFWAEIANYKYKMKKGEAKTQLLVDAGLDFNDPITPVVYPSRKADILVICDASAGKVGNELKKAADYMQRHNLPFPQINFDDIDKKTMSIFKDHNNPDAPIVWYFPRISDQDVLKNYQAAYPNDAAQYNCLKDFNLGHETEEGYATTIHFQYTPDHANRIIRQMELNVRANRENIIKALADVVDNR